MDTNRIAELQAELAAQGVRYVFAQFTDIHGAAKGKLVPLVQLGDIAMPGRDFRGHRSGAPACRAMVRARNTMAAPT
jgi:glutamine synthetase